VRRRDIGATTQYFFQWVRPDEQLELTLVDPSGRLIHAF
jgi:hypothetical protein